MPKGQGTWIRGRAASPFRTGWKIQQYLREHGELGIAEMHRMLKAEIREANLELAQKGQKKKYRPPHYQSFLVYVHALERAGLVEFAGEEDLELDRRTANLFLRGKAGEAAPPKRRLYKLTNAGQNNGDFKIQKQL